MRALPGERYLDLPMVSEKIGRSTRTIRRRVKKRTFPTPFLFDGRWTWLQSDIDRWMLRQAFENQIDPDDLPDDSAEPVGQSGTSVPEGRKTSGKAGRTD